VQIWRTMYASSTSVKFRHCKGDIDDDTSKWSIKNNFTEQDQSGVGDKKSVWLYYGNQ
jgi:hypothetical protein